MAANCVDEVELGFTEKPEDTKRLTSPYFPSKIGGKPAWLDPHLPVPDVLTCRKCGKPRVFLLQVYAPIDHLAHCYHRTLYVFCCREPSCHSRNFTEQFLVLRCNLPQLDSSYDSKAKGLSDGSAINDKDEPGAANSSTRNNSKNGLAVTIHSIAQYDSAPEDATTSNSQSNSDAVTNVVDSNDDSLMQEQQRKSLESTLKLLPPLCVVCGCSGPKWCAKCHSMYYCSREHQVIHWKAGHKKHCGDEKQPTNIDAAGRILFEEFEIVTEPEPPIKVTPERSEEERLKDYHKYLEKLSGKSEMDKMCLDDVDKDVKKDKQFMTFKKRIAVEPDQVQALVWYLCVDVLLGAWGVLTTNTIIGHKMLYVP